MKAKLKELFSLDFDLNTYWPENETNFSLILRAMIGPEGSNEAESFDIQVCTFDWLKEKYETERAVFGQQMLVVFEYDIDLIKQKVESFCDECISDNWQDIGNRLNLIGAWEFENYQSYNG